MRARRGPLVTQTLAVKRCGQMTSKVKSCAEATCTVGRTTRSVLAWRAQ